MSTVPLWPPSGSAAAHVSPLPPLIQTPSGLALLELQGSINLPQRAAAGAPGEQAFAIGRLEFPDYSGPACAEGSTAWTKRVHLYIGQHQRLTGQVAKLPKAFAVVRRRESQAGGAVEALQEAALDHLEVVEVVRHKLLFSDRPEPVGTANAP